MRKIEIISKLKIDHVFDNFDTQLKKRNKTSVLFVEIEKTVSWIKTELSEYYRKENVLSPFQDKTQRFVTNFPSKYEDYDESFEIVERDTQRSFEDNFSESLYKTVGEVRKRKEKSDNVFSMRVYKQEPGIKNDRDIALLLQEEEYGKKNDGTQYSQYEKDAQSIQGLDENLSGPEPKPKIKIT